MSDSTAEVWTPELSPKQQLVFNTGISSDAESLHPHIPTALLVSGPRETGKTIAVEHRICRHLFETPGARVGVVSTTNKNMTDGGVWQDMIDVIIPQWVEADIGFEYITRDSTGNPGPKMDSKSRTLFLKVSNMYEGESELRLISLDYEGDVKAKFKETRFSALWFTQLANFKDPMTYIVTMKQLRMIHLHKWQHLWIADTNPAEEGEDSWIYKLWYRRDSDILRKRGISEVTISECMAALNLVEIFFEDNPWLDPIEIEHTKSLYVGSAGEYAREVEGKWVKGTGTAGKHFSDVFIRGYHVVGGGPNETDQITVSPQTETLYTGWDMGAVNHSGHILESRVIPSSGGEIITWNVLDELVVIGEHVTIEEFTIQFLALMDAIELKCNKKFTWSHWSDSTATEVWRPTGASFDYLSVMAASNDRIVLEGIEKPAHSVQTRVQLVRNLLRQKRLFISSRCAATIEMLEQCHKGPSAREFVAIDRHKHPFDSLTYPIFAKSASDLMLQQSRPSADRNAPRESGIVHVSFG